MDGIDGDGLGWVGLGRIGEWELEDGGGWRRKYEGGEKGEHGRR